MPRIRRVAVLLLVPKGSMYIELRLPITRKFARTTSGNFYVGYNIPAEHNPVLKSCALFNIPVK